MTLRFTWLVLLALLFSWGFETAHFILVPHHYCEAHEEFSHDVDHHHHEVAGESVAEISLASAESDHAHEHCGFLGSARRMVVPESSVVLEDVTFESSAEFVSEPTLFSRSDLFRLAPKNSPPIRA